MQDIEWERRLSHVEDRSKSNTHRLDKLEGQQTEMGELVKSVATIAQKQVDMEADVCEVKTDIKQLLAVPADRWKTVITAVLTAAVGAVIGAVLS